MPDVRPKRDDSTLNSGRVTRLLAAAPVLRTFVQYFIAFCNRPESAGMFVRPIAPDKPVQFGDSRSNDSRDIRSVYFVMDEDERRRTQVVT